ncbi:hemicentin-2 [Trichonephila clavata]|uniref:Hemicentin-2 n=1 Tax=Trichonephila clavata TaxID=2740835 RepID=A0A8X6FAK4_TRICU|nr:hemicentin-2 [Trichonephila clavata]
MCSCKKGSTGDLCETITGCDELKCPEGISQCVLDEAAEKGVCQCTDKSKVYSNNKCIASCSEDADCNSRGTCGSDKMCSCKKGSTGDLCETITGCDELKCPEGISQCVLDEAAEKGVCQCTDKSKVYSNNKCIAACSKDDDCKNEGSCGEDKMCSCKNGTSGELCEIITGCDELKCTADISECVLDEEEEKGACQCKDESKVYFNSKCVASCSNNDDCKNRGTCGSNKVCSCKKGASGDLCDVVDGCKELKCPDDISECVFDEKAEGGVCQCKEANKVYSDGKCVACTKDNHCKNGGTCGSEKTCSCKKGTSGDQCQTIAGCDELKCNVSVSRCLLNETAEKGVCQCIDKKKQYVNNTCAACECGKGICSFRDGQKHCVCEKTFVFKESTGKCEKCDCGEGEDECYFDDENNKKCKCHEGYKSFKDIKCVECNCGGNGDCDLNDKGQKECSCHDGYAIRIINKNTTCVARCESDEECLNSGKCRDENANSAKFCECVSGTTGDNCEIITECVTGTYKRCEKSGGECTLKGTNVECTCTEPKKLDQKLKMCRDKCAKKEDCHNEAICEGDLCQCKKGTSGDDCGTIDNCEQLNCEGINAKCIYDNTIGNGTCKCNDENFLYVDKKCVEKCKTKDDCKHGAACDAELCRCFPGTSGDKCEKVDGCAELKCEDIDGECVYDMDKKKATCKCNDKEFVYKDEKCIAKWCLENCNKQSSTCDYLNGTGLCLCKDGQKYYDYAANTCKDVDKCLWNTTCEKEDKVCEKDKCVCKKFFEEDKDKKCQRKEICKSNVCFQGAKCTESNAPGRVLCQCQGENQYYSANGKCEDGSCFLPNQKGKCKGRCPAEMTRAENGECVALKDEKKCPTDCGPLGWCFKKNKDTEECRCDPTFAVAVKGKCELKVKEICATKLLLESDPYKCKCNGTFKYAQNGVTCEKRTCSDEDALSDCKSKGAICEDVWKVSGVGYKCTCPEGYAMDSGKCLDPCSRFSVKESCSTNGQVCYTGENRNADCRCSPTFVFNKVTKTCEASSSNITFMLHNLPVESKKYLKKDDIVSVNIISLSEDIINSMKKVYEKLDIAAIFNYKIDGDVILTDIWLQSQEPVPKNFDPVERLKRQKKKMEEVTILPPALLLRDDRFKEVVHETLALCSESVKRAVCGKGATCSNYKCICENGYRTIDSTIRVQGKTTILRCEDIDECVEKTHNCPVNSTCVNTPGDYFCKCTNGNRKKEGDDPNALDKKPCTSICDPNPCGAGKCQITEKFTVDCICPPGKTGSLCGRDDVYLKKASKNTTVVGAVLGTLLAITIVLIIVYIVRLKGVPCAE